MEADFSGYATMVNLKCSDGRTIMPDAFKHMDGQKVPLVWSHGHNDVTNVLGHAYLEARDGSMYCYGYFNETEKGQNAKRLVMHGDIEALSIYANKLVEKSKSVFHGFIREVSLVLSGANPGAKIDNVRLKHNEFDTEEDWETLDEEAIIHTGLRLEFEKSSSEEGDSEPDEEVGTEHEEVVVHADTDTLQDVYDSLSEEQKNLFVYMIGTAVEAAESSSAEHSDDNDEDESLDHKEGTEDMTRNVFQSAAAGNVKEKVRKELSHDDVRGIVQDAMKNGSLRDTVEAYVLKHGIDDIETLFPDAQTIEALPQFNKRRSEWVTGVLNGTRHSPFSRVKTIWADITQAEARAKGYIKGNYKIEEWFAVTKRTTNPTTIYKKQKLDRDDVVDITSFDVIAWIKAEMRLMLEEELARAVLLGDGRAVDSDDKVKDPMGASAGDGIRSILNDHELFVTTVNVNVDDALSSYDEVIDAVMDGMEYYKGTGTPTFYTTIRTLNKFLKAKDSTNRRLYRNKEEVAQALGVAKIVEVEPMNDYDGLIGVIVNLDDYTIGADKGGEINTFDDFDIDYNQQKYLIETRLSGGLTKIKSALVIRSTGASDAAITSVNDPTFVNATGVVTIVATTNVVYKNADTGATLSTGAQIALAVGATLNVQATAAAGYYFPNDAETLWTFRRRAV
jgi:hypothetical protein